VLIWGIDIQNIDIIFVIITFNTVNVIPFSHLSEMELESLYLLIPDQF